MEILKPPIALKDNQYYKAVFPKKYLFLHHTAGGNVGGAIEWWNAQPDHVATAYIIGRDGKIYQCFDPKYWSYALGLKGGTSIEKASIQIEIVSWGKLGMKGDEYYPLGEPSTRIPSSDVIGFPAGYRDCKWYQKYTDAQVEALKFLVPKVCQDFHIPMKVEPNFWLFQSSWLKMPRPGIWSHSTVRTDKSDIFPQPNLISFLSTLK